MFSTESSSVTAFAETMEDGTVGFAAGAALPVACVDVEDLVEATPGTIDYFEGEDVENIFVDVL